MATEHRSTMYFVWQLLLKEGHCINMLTFDLQWKNKFAWCLKNKQIHKSKETKFFFTQITKFGVTKQTCCAFEELFLNKLWWHQFHSFILPKCSNFKNIQITQPAASAQGYKRPCQQRLYRKCNQAKQSCARMTDITERGKKFLIIADQQSNRRPFHSPHTTFLWNNNTTDRELPE